MNPLGGNVGISPTSPQTKLQVDAASATASSTVLTIYGSGVGFSGANDADTAYSINFDGCSYTGTTGVVPRTGAQIQMLKSGTWNEATGGAGTKRILVFKTNNGTIVTPDLTERMRITNGGYLKASNNGTYYNSTAAYHELRNNTSNGYTVYISNSSASPASTYIADFIFSGATPNSAAARFWNCEDATANRAYMRSDGGLANYQTYDTNLSDIRTKIDINPLESYWDKFKNIEVVKFKYKDQTHDDYNIGVIAQQVEEVAPEFVDVDGWGETPEDGVPLKSIYTADLHHATIKVLQEAMAKIEELKSENDSLKSRIEILENK